MIWSLVYPFEIACDDLVNLHAVLKYFWLPILIFSFDFRNDWVVPLDSEDFVGNLVKFLHLSISQQLTEIFQVLSLLKGTSNRKFLLLFFKLVAIVISDWDIFPTIFLLLGLRCNGYSDLLLWDVFICRLTYCALTLQHILDSWLRRCQVPDLSLCKLEVRTQTVINNLLSLVS